MNYTEMEAKVREATNNEPWGELDFFPVSRYMLTGPRRLLDPDAGDCQRDIQLVGALYRSKAALTKLE